MAIVGEKRKFSFRDNDFTVIEVIDNPLVKLEWKWTDSLCPNCNHRVDRTVIHDFVRIEILVPVGFDEKNVARENIFIFGESLDKRTMIFPIDKYNEVFAESKKFKKFIN